MKGIIGEHPAEGVSDSDYFSFTVEGLGEIVDLTINPFVYGRNLDILAKIYTPAGTLIATSNPLTELAAGSATFFCHVLQRVERRRRAIPTVVGRSSWIQIPLLQSVEADSTLGCVWRTFRRSQPQLGTWTSVSKLILQPGTYYVSVEGTGKPSTYQDATDEPWQEAN